MRFLIPCPENSCGNSIESAGHKNPEVHPKWFGPLGLNIEEFYTCYHHVFLNIESQVTTIVWKVTYSSCLASLSHPLSWLRPPSVKKMTESQEKHLKQLLYPVNDVDEGIWKKKAPPKWWDSTGFVEASRCAIYFHLYSSTNSVKIQSWRFSKRWATSWSQPQKWCCKIFVGSSNYWMTTYGCFLKWWYPQNTSNWSFLVGKPMVVGYHHF